MAAPTTSVRSRLAVVSTPRSGNTWLRGMLADLTGSAQIAEHTPDEIRWDQLPDRVVIQIHWWPTAAFRKQLDDAGFKIVTISRHPLDLLMSILHFSRHEAQTARWLDGAAGDETPIVGCAPQDRSLLEYAAGQRFQELLSVSDSWWDVSDAAVRYEDLVAAPEQELHRLVDELGLDVDVDQVTAVVQSRQLDAMRATSSNHHYWQGTPGGWRRLLPTDTAARLAGSVHDFVAARGYTVDPLPDLDAELAAQNWRAVEAR